jgi:NAD-dependent deacetylase
MPAIKLANYQRIVILTGAGVSVASGIRPFRGKDGLWEQPNLKIYSEWATFKQHPVEAWRFWLELRQKAQEAQPNRGHFLLAELEQQLRPDQQLVLITQNVDGLHQRAGSRNVVELHGRIYASRCSDLSCSFPPFADQTTHFETIPTCPTCHAILRPDIVLFGEALPLNAEWAAKRALRDCDLFIAIGTSGTVSPAADFVRGAEYAGGRTIYINPEPMNPPNRYFQETFLVRSEEMDGLFG